MEAFLIYSLKLTVFLTVLYICIRAFLSKETFYSFNRWVLLGGVVLCLLLPFVKVTVSESMAAHMPSLLLENFFSNEVANEEFLIYEQPSYSYTEGIEAAETIEYTKATILAEDSSVGINLSIVQILIILYIVGLLVNVAILGRSVYLMMKLIHSNPWQDYQGYKLILTTQNVVPFSWRRYIVISKADFNDNPDEILTHEIAHIEHRHSLDIIFMECVLLLQWFNPAAWLLKRELKDIHEYQADMSVLESGIDTTKYQLLLVKKAVGASSYTLANSFNHSKIKKRITMMLKEKSSKWARLKLLLLLPLGTLTVFAFARPDVNEAVSSSADYESTINFEENEIKQSLNMQDNAEKGIVVHINMKNRKNLLYYPIAYDEAKEGEKPIHDKFVKYVVESKEYTREGFEELIKGKMYFKTETNIKSKDNVVLEFHCITQKGVKTPTLYMLKVEDETPFTPPAFTKDMEPIDTYDITLRDKGNKRKSTERFVPPVIKKDNSGTQQKKAKPNYYKYTEYEVDGKKMSLEEYKKIEANSLDVLHEEYIPFAKGEIVKVTGVFNTGKKADHSSYREMFVDGKAPDRSHVEFIVDGVSYNYTEGSPKAAGVKYATLEDAKKGKSANGKPKTCQIKSKDGSRSSKVFYSVSFTPPPSPITKNTDKKKSKTSQPTERIEKKEEKERIQIVEAPVVKKKEEKERIQIVEAPVVKKKEEKERIQVVEAPVVKKQEERIQIQVVDVKSPASKKE